MTNASTFLKLFSLPKILEMPAAGIDISDRSVKYFEFTARAGRPEVLNYGEVPIPLGAITSGQIEQPAVVAEALAVLAKKLKTKNVYVSLPEELAYVIKMQLASMPKADLRSSIELQLEDYIPLPVNEIIFDYEICTEPTEGNSSYDLSVSIFPLKDQLEYDAALRSAGLWPLAYEIEAQSIARALLPAGEAKTIMLVDIGKTRTGIAVVSDGICRFTATIGTIGGEYFSSLLQKSLGVSAEEAEKIKKAKGLAQVGEQDKSFEALAPAISILSDEIGQHYHYWQEHATDGNPKERIDGLILCGGQSTLPGLTDYLARNLKTVVAVGNPWTNIFTDKNKVLPLHFNEAVSFATAIGVALRPWLSNF
jgi:type IV pilus assembly protein PilM